MACRKISLPCSIHCCPPFFFYFFQLTSIFWRICMYTHTHTHTHKSDCIEIVYELLLLSDNIVSEIFLHKLGAVWSVHWIFITGAPAWQWLGEYVTWDKTFYNFFSNRKLQQPQLLPCFLPYRIPQGGLY